MSKFFKSAGRFLARSFASAEPDAEAHFADVGDRIDLELAMREARRAAGRPVSRLGGAVRG